MPPSPLRPSVTARGTRRGSYRGNRDTPTGGARVAPPGCGSTVARTLFLVLAITYLPLPSTSRGAAPPARLEVSPDMDRTDPGGAFQHPRRPWREGPPTCTPGSGTPHLAGGASLGGHTRRGGCPGRRAARLSP